MEYLVGTQIDLSYINKTLKKNTDSQEPRKTLYEIGSKVLFVSWQPFKTYTIAPA